MHATRDLHCPGKYPENTDQGAWIDSYTAHAAPRAEATEGRNGHHRALSSFGINESERWSSVKVRHLTAIFLSAALTGCSSPAASTKVTSTAPSTTSTSHASPSPAIVVTAAPEPATLEEALAAANRDHVDVIEAVGAMEDLYRQAQKTLKPAMTSAAWGELDIIRINTSLGALRDMSDREVLLGVKRYTIAVETEAVRQGKA